MCKDTESLPKEYSLGSTTNQVTMPRESHMIYELKQKREYHIMQLVNIQKAIDAINLVEGLY